MQDLSKKIPFLRYRKLLWKSYPYKLYLKVYEYILLGIIKRASSNNLKVIFINGMRRSGNHFLMNTLLNSTDASVIFFNNHPKKSQLTIDGGVQTNFKNKRILVIIGFEDLQIKEYEKFSNIITKRFFENKISKKLVVLRDARNIMASRLNHAHMHKNLKLNRNNSVLLTRKLWIDNHLSDSKDISFVRYNFLNEDLGKIDFKDFFINEIKTPKNILNRYGGGSSFETKGFSERYNKFIDDIVYNKLISGLKDIDENYYDKKWK